MGSIFTPVMKSAPSSQRGEPAWEIALLFPAQGQWTEAEYLALDTNHLVELVDGCLEVHPMATLAHQLILKFLLRLLDDFVNQHRLGTVVCAPLPVKILPTTYREPDVVFLKSERIKDRGAPPVGADLVVEIVSEGSENRKRDLETKRREYAAAGITEYWIVDPEQATIIVLALDGAAYREHGVFRIGDTAASVLLPGFTVAVQDALAAGQAGA